MVPCSDEQEGMAARTEPEINSFLIYKSSPNRAGFVTVSERLLVSAD
jgi:hypothetical protein